MSTSVIFGEIAKSIWRNPGNRGKRLSKVADAVGWQIDKRVFRRARRIVLPNGFFFMVHPDSVVASSLIYADWPEFTELQFCRSQLSRGEGIIDVGANVGHFTLLLADITGWEKVRCYEPMPVAWRRCVENFELNGAPEDHVLNSAVGATRGSVRFPNPNHPITTASLSVPMKGAFVEVPLIPLDSLAPSSPPGSVGLLKIDVEGYESEVFLGARQFLTLARPRLIMFESLAGNLDAVIGRVLSEAKYKVFKLDEAGRPVAGPLDAQNLFAAPEELSLTP